MQTIKTAADLKKAITALEDKQAIEWPLLKEQFLNTYESFKLSNVLKNTFKEVITAPGMKNDLINSVLGLTTGFVANKTIIGKTDNPLKKLLGFILEMTVANKVAQHADAIKTIGSILVNKVVHLKNHKSNNGDIL